jgi:anti-sigma B factor antagonist
LIVHDDGVVVCAVGEIDASTCCRLDEVLLSLDEARPALVDLSGVTFMDSTGLRVLIDHHSARADDRSGLMIRNPSQPVRRLLEISGLQTVLRVVSE